MKFIKNINKKNIKKYFAVFLAALTVWLSLNLAPSSLTGLSGETKKITVSQSLIDAGLSVFVSGAGVEKESNTVYVAEVGTSVTIAAINESAQFLSWNVSGATVAAAVNSYTTINSMPSNDVTLNANVAAATTGTTLSTAYVLDEFDDFYALQEIIARATITDADAPKYNEYLSKFGLSCTKASDYVAPRQKLQIGHFVVTTTVSLSPPAKEDNTPSDKIFTGIGGTNTAATSFQGVIDGRNNAVVINMNYINSAATTHQYTGLFGAVPAYSHAVVNGAPKPPIVLRNLNVMGSILSEVNFNNLAYNNYIGGISGILNTNIVMYNCKSEINISAKATYQTASASKCLYLGGLVGYLSAPIAHMSNNRYNVNNLTLSGETSSVAYVGGCFGMVNNTYVLDARANLNNCNLSAVSTNKTAATSSAHAGGIVGHFNGGAKLENCFTASKTGFTVNATTDGTTTAYTACSGGIAGLITGTPELANNNVSSNAPAADTESKGYILCRDLTSSTVSTVYAGGLYGRFATALVKLAGVRGSLNASDSNDCFNGRIEASTLINGKTISYTGGIVGYGNFTTIPANESYSFNLSDVAVKNIQKNTTTGVCTSYVGGLAGGLPSNSALNNITIYGNNANIETQRESGASGNTSAIQVGGLVGYKSGGATNNCKILLTNSKIQINQDSYLSTSGNCMVGGFIGYSDATSTVTNCLIAGPYNSARDEYSGSTSLINCVINTKPGAHGVSDGYVGSIVGKANSNSHITNSHYLGSNSSGNDGIVLHSNNSSNSPSLGGIVGHSVGSKITDCTVKFANIYGDGYNNDLTKTDTDIIVGGIAGLINGLSSIENCTVSDSRIEAFGRDYTLTYAGGILGSHFGANSAVIRGNIFENNKMYVNAQKKWAAGGGIVGYHYDGTLTIDNCMSIGNTIYGSASSVEEGQYTEVIAGGILGRVNHDSTGYVTKITNCYSNTECALTHVQDNKICYGGIIGFRTSVTNLTFSNNYFHIQNMGTNIAVGNNPNSTTALAEAGLDFSPRLLDNAHPVKTLFQAGPNTSNSILFTDDSQKHTSSFITTARLIDGVSQNNKYIIEKKNGFTAVGSSVFHASIRQYSPGTSTLLPDAVTRKFGTINVTVIDGNAPVITSVSLRENIASGPEVSQANGNNHIEMKIDANSPGKNYYALSAPKVITSEGELDLTRFVFYGIVDSVYTPMTEASLTQYGVTVRVEGNKVNIKPNTAIDATRTFAVQAVDAITGNIKSEMLIVTVDPVFVQEVRMDSFVSPEKVGFGSFKDSVNPLGSAANPFIIVNNSTLNLNIKVYGEGSRNIWRSGEVYVTPTNQMALFTKAEYVSGKANALNVYADGTIFTSTAAGDDLTNTVYRTRAGSVGKDSNGNQVWSDYIYIRIVEPLAVTKMTAGTINKNTMVIPSGYEDSDVSYIVKGGNITGSNTSLLAWNADYVFTTSPQATHGGEPEVYYVIGTPSASNPYKMISIGDENAIAYGKSIGSYSNYNFEFRIKANSSLSEPLTIVVKYHVITPVLFYPQNGNDPITLSMPIGKRIGTAMMNEVKLHWSGYILDGWYSIDDSAETEGAYGSPLTSDTVITGGNTFYARWKYKIEVSDTPTLAFSSNMPVNKTKDFVFEITKDISYDGLPDCFVRIETLENPLPIPFDYDDEAEIPYYNTINGKEELCGKLVVSKNDKDETVYTYTFFSLFLQSVLGTDNSEKSGISITTAKNAVFKITAAGDGSTVPSDGLQQKLSETNSSLYILIKELSDDNQVVNTYAASFIANNGLHLPYAFPLISGKNYVLEARLPETLNYRVKWVGGAALPQAVSTSGFVFTMPDMTLKEAFILEIVVSAAEIPEAFWGMYDTWWKNSLEPMENFDMTFSEDITLKPTVNDENSLFLVNPIASTTGRFDTYFYGDVTIEEGVTVIGNIFAKGDVYIFGYVNGSVYSEKMIHDNGEVKGEKRQRTLG